jgi:hypothetical protein
MPLGPAIPPPRRHPLISPSSWPRSEGNQSPGVEPAGRASWPNSHRFAQESPLDDPSGPGEARSASGGAAGPGGLDRPAAGLKVPGRRAHLGELVLPIPNPIWSAWFVTTPNESICFWSCATPTPSSRGHVFDNSARQHRRQRRAWEAIVRAGRPANRRRVRPTEDSSSLTSCQPRPRRSAADPIDGSQWAST